MNREQDEARQVATLQNIECCLFGAIGVSPSYALSRCEAYGVTEEWFTHPFARAAWPVVLKLWKENVEIEASLVARELNLPAVAQWLMKGMEMVGTSLATPKFLEELSDALMKRRLVNLSQQILIDSNELGTYEAVQRTQASLEMILQMAEKHHGSVQQMEVFAKQAMEEATKLYEERVVKGNRDYYNGLTLPWSVLNSHYAGIKAGVHIIAARPSQGKTALAVTLCAGMAHENIPQLFISLDMGKQKLVERYGSLLGQVSLAKLNHDPSQKDLSAFKKGLERIPKNCYVSNSNRIDRIIGEIYTSVKFRGIKCVWIDYLQILVGEKDYYRSRKEEIDAVLSQLKQCAYNLNIPIFCLAQLNRDSGKNPNARPTLVDLGDSGNIEREAATVLILWKDPIVRQNWDQNPPLRLAKGSRALASALEPMWLLLIKNQQGATGNFPFVLYKNTFMFRPADHEALPLNITDKSGKIIGKDYSPSFNTIRDDGFILTEADGSGLDDYLYRAGALGKRGI